MLAHAVWILAAATAIGVPLYSWRARGRQYAIFAAVVLAIALPGAVVLHLRLRELLGIAAQPWLDAAFSYSMAVTGLQLAALVRARLRHAVYRWLVGIPGQAFLAGGALGGVWLVALLPVRAVLWSLGWDAALGWLAWADALPLAIAALSIVTSSRPKRELVRVALGEDGPDEVRRVPVERYRRRRPAPLAERPLRIVQITDPHLGPWQPIRKLRRHVDELVAHDPDLVLLTGDFLTMEGRGSPGGLEQALDPLRKLAGRCFAVFGNHDHEAPDEVRSALESNGVVLLVDDEAIAHTEVGPVQLVGADYVGRGREKHIPELLARFPRRDGHLRLFLLHDPHGFHFVPKDDVDLTLSGHTHGGQLGLVSFGLDWTVLARSRWPDHGLFARGRSRLYVHRGTGFYGFPLRVGVPGEASLLEVVF
jgi:hypothetical protein